MPASSKQPVSRKTASRKRTSQPASKQPSGRKVRCAACDKVEPDEGIGKTCSRCGCSPLPSYDYDVTSCFHPKDVKPKRPTGKNRKKFTGSAEKAPTKKKKSKRATSKK